MTEPITGSNLLLENELNALAERLKASGQTEITHGHIREALAEKMSSAGAATQAGAVSSDDNNAPDFHSKPANLKTHGELKVKTGQNYLDSMPEAAGLIVNGLLSGLPELGLAKTIDRAQAESPFILDAFHDALTTRLYGELKSRKLI